jgi:LysM repeat protein
MAVRLASVAALATGGVALGRGVVNISNMRSSLEHLVTGNALAVEAAHPSTSLESVAGVVHPTFSSSLRSWMAPPAPSAPAPTEPTPVAVVTEPVTAEAAETYVVSAGDTLSDIAEQHSVDVSQLASANHLSDVNTLLPGARLVIPATTMDTARAATTLAQPTTTPARVPVQVPTTPPNAPAPATVVTRGAATPDAAVRGFYARLEQGQFGHAADLWTPRMQTAYPPAEYINGRFARTQSLTVNRADVIALDATSGRATVALQLSEVVGPPPSTRQYVGTWSVVRGPNGWQLDQPNLKQN